MPFVVAALTLAVCSASLTADPATAAVRQQHARLIMLPQIVQPGLEPRNANAARSALSAVFGPARAGRTVVLQRRDGRRWVEVARGRENSSGTVQFSASYRLRGRIAQYRAYAVRYRALGRVTTAAARTDRWGPADYTEQFSGSYSARVLPSSWSHRDQTYGAVANRHCAASVPRGASVGHGTAHLKVRRSSGPDPVNQPWCHLAGDPTHYDWRINGNISTRSAYSFRYGFPAARIKFQPRAGQHGGFWLLPDATAATSGSHGAEVDVIEWYGNRRSADHELSCQVHTRQASYPASGHAYVRDPGRFGSRWAGRYHVFSVEWTPSAYTFRIDGKRVRRITRGVSDQPEYLVLSLLSSDWELNMAARAIRQTMHVDWVRVWDRRP